MNGEHSDDYEQPTERTALLAGRIVETSTDPHEYPAIEPVVSQAIAKGIASCGNSDWCPHLLPSPGTQTAYALVALLELRRTVTLRPVLSSSIWEEWSKEQEDVGTLQDLDRHILSVWSEFLGEERSVEEILDVLWHTFVFSHEDPRPLRVVDYLCYHGAPQEFLEHPIMFFSLLHAWKYGPQGYDGDLRVSARSIRAYDALCTPRVLHSIALLTQMTYLVLLAHFVLLPPKRSATTVRPPLPDVREILLMIYAGARLLQAWSLGTMPFILVLLAFSSCMPSVPYTDSLAYSALLFAFSWSVIELHIPRFPSPIFLFPFQQILPLAVLIWHGVSRIFFPVVAFFLPALLLSLFLLSTSLSDIFAHLLMVDDLDPAPMETRIAFVSLFAVMFLLMICSVIMLVLIYPSLSSDAHLTSPWDRYSIRIGREARRAFVRVVVIYSIPYVFPPPFNMLQLIVVQLPTRLAIVMDWKKAILPLKAIEKLLWRVTVGPIAAIFAGVWLWGMRGPRRRYLRYS